MSEPADWFETLTGFRETSYQQTQANFEVADGCLRSRINGRTWAIGNFEMVSLARLRELAAKRDRARGRPRVSVIEGDVRRLHGKAEYAGALFQVASQFNALEMTGPDVTPEDGVTRYFHDRTQGPACALAAAPATIYRNYFAPVGDGVGQTRTRQLDGLAEIGSALSSTLARPIGDLWAMRNGYALCSREGLAAVTAWLRKADAEEINALRAKLSIGLHRDVETTVSGGSPDIRVSQAFCSALPVAYSPATTANWGPFATLVLDGASLLGFLQVSDFLYGLPCSNAKM
jgi:hypothetical protein